MRLGLGQQPDPLKHVPIGLSAQQDIQPQILQLQHQIEFAWIRTLVLIIPALHLVPDVLIFQLLLKILKMIESAGHVSKVIRLLTIPVSTTRS